RSLHRDTHVLERGQVREDVRDLIGFADSEAGDGVLRQAGDVPPVEGDRSGRGRHLAGDEPGEGRLAGAVRTDDRAELAAPDGDRHLLDGDQASERAGQVARLQQDGIGHTGALYHAVFTTVKDAINNAINRIRQLKIAP